MLKRSILAVVAVAFLVSVAGCTSMSNTIPGRQPGLEELSTEATYDVIGPTEGTSSGGRLFWFIPIGMENKAGNIGGRIIPFPNPVLAAATYNAIENVPGADAMIAPRYNIVTKNYFIYKEQTVTIKGKAIRYNTSD